MNTSSSAFQEASESISHQQALALWTYIHKRINRFTYQNAHKVIQDLSPAPGEDIKQLAVRLRILMSGHGFKLKHNHALHAASLLFTNTSWHEQQSISAKAFLKLTDANSFTEQTFESWSDIWQTLCKRCDAWLQQHGGRSVKLRFKPRMVMLCATDPENTDLYGLSNEAPILLITPETSDEYWLQDAPSAFEKLRRHLEESGKAVLDGFAVLQLCNQYTEEVLAQLPQIPQPVRPDDACNSELVLSRVDNEMMPNSGYEIARGDELTCWSQYDLEAKKLSTTEITVNDGAWQVGKARFVWDLATIHPTDYMPGLVQRWLSTEESQKLLRRYRLTKRIFSGNIKQYEVTKQLDYLNEGPPDEYRINLHRLLLELNRAGMTWDEYCHQYDHPQELKPVLPIGFVIKLAENLDLKSPHILLAAPLRSELQHVENPALLRTLLPRVSFARYRITSKVSEEQESIVSELMQNLNLAIHVRPMISAGTLDSPSPIPYSFFASEAEELFVNMAENNFSVYAGVIPHLHYMEHLPEDFPEMSRYALGHSLFLDIEPLEEGAQ